MLPATSVVPEAPQAPGRPAPWQRWGLVLLTMLIGLLFALGAHQALVAWEGEQVRRDWQVALALHGKNYRQALDRVELSLVGLSAHASLDSVDGIKALRQHWTHVRGAEDQRPEWVAWLKVGVDGQFQSAQLLDGESFPAIEMGAFQRIALEACQAGAARAMSPGFGKYEHGVVVLVPALPADGSRLDCGGISGIAVAEVDLARLAATVQAQHPGMVTSLIPEQAAPPSGQEVVDALVFGGRHWKVVGLPLKLPATGVRPLLGALVALLSLFVVAAIWLVARVRAEEKERVLRAGVEKALRRHLDLIEAIESTQAAMLAGKTQAEVCDHLLSRAMALTASRMGMLAEMVAQTGDEPSMRILSLLEGRNALPGTGDAHALRGGCAEVYAGNLPLLMKGGGMPSGLPVEDAKIGAYMVLPLLFESRLVGLLVLANAQGGYGEHWPSVLAPFVGQAANLLEVMHGRRLQEQAEARLAESARDLRLVFDNASVGIAVTRDRHFVRCNSRLAAMLGYSPGELEGAPAHIIYPGEESYARLGRLAAEALPKGDVLDTELEMRRKDGYLCWVRLRARAVEAEDRRLGTIWIAEDISGRKQLEREVNRFHRTLQDIQAISLDLHGTPDERIGAVLAMGMEVLDCEIALVAEVVGDQYTVRHCRARGEPIEVGTSFDLGQTYCAWVIEAGEVVAHHDIGSGDYCNHPCYQSMGLNAYIGAPLRVGDRLFGTLGFSGVAVHQPFSESDRTIVEMISRWIGVELTRAEQRQALENARHEAEAANRSKSVFVANMSHEIRTPLHAIMGYAQLLQGMPLGRSEHHYVGGILQAGEALRGVIEDVLDLSRIEAGRIELRSQVFTLESLFERLRAVFARRAREQGVLLTFRLAPDLPDRLMGDGDRLLQILINLVGNALKFTKEGSVVVDVQGTRQPESMLDLDVRVVDTGVGFDPKLAEQLFEPFEQGDSGLARHNGGAGLGLAISRRLARAMSGDVTATSVEGKGSVFSVRLQYQVHPEAVLLSAMARELPEGTRIAAQLDCREGACGLDQLCKDMGLTWSTPDSLGEGDVLLVEPVGEAAVLLSQSMQARGVAVIAAVTRDDPDNQQVLEQMRPAAVVHVPALPQAVLLALRTAVRRAAHVQLTRGGTVSAVEPDVAHALSNLLATVRSRRIRAKAEFEVLRPRLGSRVKEDVLDDIAGLLLRYDFPGAERQLETLLARLDGEEGSP